jgi:hypothetical protein
MSRRLARVAALAIGLAAFEAQALEATLSVAPATSLSVAVDAIGTASGPVTVTGDVDVTVHVADHPSFGTVATAVTPRAGRLYVGNLSFNPSFGSHVTLSLSTSGLEAAPDGPPVAATPTGPGTAQAPLDGIGFVLDAGTASAIGTALGSSVNQVSDFGVSNGALHEDTGAQATVETSGPPGGPVDVTVTIPVDTVLLAVAGPPLDVPITLQGQLVLTGTAVAAPVPALQAPALGVVAALLLVSAALAWRQRASAATATARSRRG